MTVEEQFRDIQGQRFGVRLFWTQCRDPEKLTHLVTFLAVALLIWTLTGEVASLPRSLAVPRSQVKKGHDRPS